MAEQDIMKQGLVNIQYSLKGRIHSCLVTITKEHFIIEDHNENEKSTDAASCIHIHWKQLINIDDLSNSNLHSFQLLFKDKTYPSIYIHCDSKSKKTNWIQVFVKMCPRFILTKELQTLKRCAINLGFTKSQIESALIRYHEQYDTVYNVDAFICTIIEEQQQNSDSKTNDNDDGMDKSLQCSICHTLYTDAVRNIYNQTYCHHCIEPWFNMIKEDQTQIKDPYTNQPLPQNTRFLIPHFSMMVKVWNHAHIQNEKISDVTHAQIKSVDDELNERRKNILHYLQSTQHSEQIATEMAERILSSDKGLLNKKDLNDVLNDAMDCYKWFNEIKDLMNKGTDIYNNAIKRIIDNHSQKKYLFKWKEPKWKSVIDKNSTNWSELYQLDESLLSEIQTHTTQCIHNISKMIEEQTLTTQQLKDKILEIILQKQTEIITDNDDEKIDCEKQKQRLKMERIMYTEKNGLVNTRCITEIAECVRNKKAFEVYHNDLNHKTMNRDQLIRFLETGGMNGIENQHYIYKCFAMGIKDKMLRLSSYLKSLNKDKLKKYYPYFRYLESVDIIEEPIMDPKQWNQHNDKVELKIKFKCDYGEHLAKYNGNKRKLSDEIKRQMLKHLKLKNAAKYVMIADIKKGSIDVRLLFIIPLAAIAYGCYDFNLCFSERENDPKFYVATKRALLQGMAVGGGIGCIIGAVAAAILVTSVAAAVGCVVGAIVVCGALGAFIGHKIWKRLNPPRIDDDVELNIMNDNAGPGYEDNRPQRVRIDQPGGGHRWMTQFCVNVDDIDSRVKQNGEQWNMILECNHTIEYDAHNAQMEGEHIRCKVCGELSCVSELEAVIRNKDQNKHRRARYAIRNVPQPVEVEFGLEDSDNDGSNYDD